MVQSIYLTVLLYNSNEMADILDEKLTFFVFTTNKTCNFSIKQYSTKILNGLVILSS